MDSTGSDRSAPPSRPWHVKTVVAGGFGVGKTTFVGSVSDLPPVTTEALMTEASTGHDDLSLTRGKRATTVAMDFGRVLIRPDLVASVFGTPGQQRFWFMWDDLVRGAAGAVVLADTRRLEQCFSALDYFEHHGVPYLVAVNGFDGAPRHRAEHVREALDLSRAVPVHEVDARYRHSCHAVLAALVEHTEHVGSLRRGRSVAAPG